MRFVVLPIVFTVLFCSAPARADKIDTAITLLKSPAFKIRAQAALALGGQRNSAQRIIRPLIGALKDSHRAVRASAAIALGKLGEPGSISALSEAVTDDDMTVSKVSRKALKKVVRDFVQKRGFEERRFTFTIQALTLNSAFKDHVMEGLMAYQNVDVGSTFDFDDRNGTAMPSVELDISGHLVSVSDNAATVQVTLALQRGGHVVTQFEKITAHGKTREETLAKTASSAVGQVLGFLGAKEK